MSEYEEHGANYCPECGVKLRDAWRVPLAAAPKESIVAVLTDDDEEDVIDGHVTVDQAVTVYLHATGGEES